MFGRVGAIRRTTTALAIAALTLAGCIGDGEGSTFTLAPTTTRVVVELLTPPECSQQAVAAIQPLQDFVDQYEGFTAERWNALDPPPDIEAVQEDVLAIAQSAVDRGCNADVMQQELQASLELLEGEGEVGSAIVAALRGLGPPLGPPQLVPESTVPRDERASVVTFHPGVDSDRRLREVLDRIAPGSTVEFLAGEYVFDEPIVVNVDARFTGVGRQRTRILSSAEGVALAFVGPGGFELSNLSIQHTGIREASVFLAIEGPVRIDAVDLSGGVAGDDEESGGGHGVIFAFDPIEGFPQRTPDERAGELLLDDVTVFDNEAAGVLSTGDARPRITNSTLRDNRGCGLCYVGRSGGSTSAVTLQANAIGVQAGDQTTPALRQLRVIGNESLGISIDGQSTASVIDGEVTGNGDVGVQIAGEATASLTATTVSDHGVGVLVTETATATIQDNTIQRHTVGIQGGAESTASIRGNEIIAATATAVSLSGSGDVTGNSIVAATDVGIQIAGSGTTRVVDNEIDDAGTVGISFLETAAGAVTGNRVSLREIGIQVGGAAVVDVTGNRITESVATGVLFGGSATGNIEDNDVSAPDAAGIVVSGTAAPTVSANRITQGAAGLVYREQASGFGEFNTITGLTVGVQVIDQATPTLLGNVITASVEAGVIYSGSSGGVLDANTIVRNGQLGVQVGDSAAPRIVGNELRGPGVYGVIYKGSAKGRLESNTIADLVFAVQLNNDAAPDLIGNTLTGIALTGISYADNTAGSIDGNRCEGSSGGFGAGISITTPANPVLGVNECSISRAA